MTRLQALILILVMLIGFIVGRNTVDKSTQDVKETDTNAQVKTVIVEKKEKDGTIETTTTTTKDVVSVSKEDKTQTIAPTKSLYNVQAIIATDFKSVQPIYGVSASKQFLGPVSLGVFGLTNKTIGVTIGITF